MESFIAIIPLSPEQGPSVVQKRRGKADACGMTIRQDRPFFLATSENLPLMRCGDALVLGSIFATDKSDPAHLPPDFAQAVDEPALRRIFRDYWGNFIAIMPDADRHGYHILRSPFGRLPCFPCYLLYPRGRREHRIRWPFCSRSNLVQHRRG